MLYVNDFFLAKMNLVQPIAHRGNAFAKFRERENTLSYLLSALDSGFGIETDLRFDCRTDKICISHDPIQSTDKPTSFEELLQSCTPSALAQPFALNVKEDALSESIERLALQYGLKDYFLFDHSLPDLLVSAQTCANLFTRHSEFEKSLPLISGSISGVWLDMFNGCIIPEDLQLLSENFNRIALVSPELHSHTNHHKMWHQLLEFASSRRDVRWYICTDLASSFSDLMCLYD